MEARSDKRKFLKYLLRIFSFEPDQSPFFFHGLLTVLWRATDFVPGRLGVACRWWIGKRRFKKLGKYPYFRAHNTFFDGRNIEIGDDFYAGSFNYFAGGPIKIGNHTAFANYIIVETTDHNFDDPDLSIRKQGLDRKPVVIEDDVWIGDRVTILGGVTIGTGSIVGAGSVVVKDIPPYSVVIGNPARVVRQRGRTKEGKLVDGQGNGP